MKSYKCLFVVLLMTCYLYSFHCDAFKQVKSDTFSCDAGDNCNTCSDCYNLTTYKGKGKKEKLVRAGLCTQKRCELRKIITTTVKSATFSCDASDGCNTCSACYNLTTYNGKEKTVKLVRGGGCTKRGCRIRKIITKTVKSATFSCDFGDNCNTCSACFNLTIYNGKEKTVKLMRAGFCTQMFCEIHKIITKTVKSATFKCASGVGCGTCSHCYNLTTYNDFESKIELIKGGICFSKAC